MNEKNNNPIQPEKPLDEKRKNALLRYLGIMFAVAFILVLLSLAGEVSNFDDALSQMNASSTSALQKAEQLQDENRELATEVAYLEGRIEEMEKQLEETELELAISEEALQNKKDQLTEMTGQMTEEQAFLGQIQAAYELLLEASENPELLPELENHTQYLGENALKFYENLTKEGEE